MRRRPELNGATAKVTCRVADEEGYMMLDVLHPETQQIKKMRVHNLRLQPLSPEKCHSSPALLSATLGAHYGLSLENADSHVSINTLVSRATAAKSRSGGQRDAKRREL